MYKAPRYPLPYSDVRCISKLHTHAHNGGLMGSPVRLGYGLGVSQLLSCGKSILFCVILCVPFASSHSFFPNFSFHESINFRSSSANSFSVLRKSSLRAFLFHPLNPGRSSGDAVQTSYPAVGAFLIVISTIPQ